MPKLIDMLHVLDHPLGHHLITHLRDKTTKPANFRTLTHHISILLAIEATRDLATRDVGVESPLEKASGRVLDQSLVLIPLMRAGLSMVEPISRLFPDVNVGYIGLERDHETAIARNYYCKLPALEDARVLVLDPMLATGGSAVKALDAIKERGARQISMLNVVAAPEGVSLVREHHPDVEIYTGVLDYGLNKDKYILPGLGDYGDRLFGT